MAIGDETGTVILFNSAKDIEQAPLSLKIKSHSNAVMDLAFSSDDSTLASASGDQNIHIVDVSTSQPKFVLTGHTASVRQVRFQPGNDSVLASSARDGTVHMWDLRCRGKDSIIQIRPESRDGSEVSQQRAPHLNTYNTIPDAHGDSLNAATSLNGDSSSKFRSDVSVTSLEFLSHGRNNLIITGASANTSVRLWDIRGRYSRRGASIPISSTILPEAHSSHRHYGINSIALNTDESRLYALSRDNTIYAYSTSHLVLGHAPELSTTSDRPSRYGSTAKKGLGPIYGFRHPNFFATSFFVKAALRRATLDKPELLAVGSSDACPILFPTDEAFLSRSPPNEDNNKELPRIDSPMLPQAPAARPGLRRTVSNSGLAARANDTIPIYNIGTALVRGHEKVEVTSLAWTRRGDLVSIADDFTARIWREGPQARELRVGGEAEGRRWGCGWAEAEPGFDDEDE